MNLNSLARQITLKEGKKKNVSIAQVKEILKITLKILRRLSVKDLITLLARIK